MEAVYPHEIIHALKAQVAVLDGEGAIIAVNSRWQRSDRLAGATGDCVGKNYLEICAAAVGQGERGAMRVLSRLHRLLDGELESFALAYGCAPRFYRLRATRVAVEPVRVLVAREDITTLLEKRRKLYAATIGLSNVRNQHATRIGEAYEELGQRLAAIALATHAIAQASQPSAPVTTIRMAVDEARQELRVLRQQAESDAG